MSGPHDVLNRRTALATAAIGLLLGLFAMNYLPIGLFDDDGHYLILSRALAAGDGFHYPQLPGAPPALHFPPGYPLLLAPLWWIAPHFPENVVYIKLFNAAWMPVLAVAARAMARQIGGLPEVAASAVGVAVVGSVPFLFLNGLVFSETVFTAALCGTLLLAEGVAARGDVRASRVVLCGIAIGATALVRSLGLAVLPALVAVLVWDRRWRHAALTAIAASSTMLPWQWWKTIQALKAGGAGDTYAAWVIEAYQQGGAAVIWDVMRLNLSALGTPLSLLESSPTLGWVRAAAAVPALVFLFTGLRRAWPRARVSALASVSYLAVLLVWPFPPARFLWPLLPLLLTFVVCGALSMHRSLPRSTVPGAAVRLAGLALVAMFVSRQARAWTSREWEGLTRRRALAGVAAVGVASQLPRDGVIASDMNTLVHLYTGRQVVPLVWLSAIDYVRPRTDDEAAAQFEAVLRTYEPRWLLITEPDARRAADLLVRRGTVRRAATDSAGVFLFDVRR